MAFKKRKKVSRHRGTHTHGRGFKKKARGKGHRGGIGMAGSGKRADQKKTKVVGKGKKYFGKSKTLRAPQRRKTKSITLKSIQSNLQNFVKKGIAKESSGTYSLDLKNYKVIGDSDVNVKLNIKAKLASENAKEKVKAAGGSIEIEKKAETPSEEPSKKKESEEVKKE